MADILLVHGSCHGAWCWRDLIPELEALGHQARAIDMPSHGADPTPVAEVTLDSCAQAIVDALRKDTIVVAHSWGGFPAARAADLAPMRMQHLIFLAAYAPWDGLSLAEMRNLAPRSKLLDAVIRAQDGKSFMVDPTKATEIFYHDCPEGTMEYAFPRLCPQPIAPHETPISLGNGYASISKSYIRCSDDRTIAPEFQITMTEDWPEKDVYTMPTGHSPFFADPAGLARLIDQISG